MVAKHQTNPQYTTLTDAAAKTYATSSEMSIEFEVDGPYKVRALQGSKNLPFVRGWYFTWSVEALAGLGLQREWKPSPRQPTVHAALPLDARGRLTC